MTNMRLNSILWFIKLCLISIFLIIFTGCASIIKGGTQAINIKTTPSDAKVTISNLRTQNEFFNAKSPVVVTLERGDGYFKEGMYKVAIEKDGYERKEISLTANVNGWYVAGNILLGGLIGWCIVDPITGAMWNLSPETIDIALTEKATPTQGNGSPSINMNKLDAVPDEKNKTPAFKEEK
jgi:hypothetical protein